MVTDDPARGHALPAPRASSITPDSLEEFRRQLSTGSEEQIEGHALGQAQRASTDLIAQKRSLV